MRKEHISVKKILFAVLTSIALTLSMVACAPQSNAADLGPAVFLSPHQDDESLTMGAAIREHVLAGRQVFVVLLTDGAGTGVCQEPPYNGDLQLCKAERDMEFSNAVVKMGAIPSIPDDRMADGTLTGAYTAEIIKKWATEFPNASFKTMSEYDSIHPDHRAAGRGLYAAYLWGYTNDARWYVRREDQKVHAGTCTSRHNLDTALAYYYPVDGNPYSGIGYKSVPTEFKWANHSDGIYGPAAYSKAFTPSQRGANGGSYAACYPNM